MSPGRRPGHPRRRGPRRQPDGRRRPATMPPGRPTRRRAPRPTATPTARRRPRRRCATTPGTSRAPCEASIEAGQSVADPAGGHTDHEPLVQRPALLRHAPVAGGRGVPPLDNYSLRLVAGHKLYDDGTLTQQSPSLAPLAPGARPAGEPDGARPPRRHRRRPGAGDRAAAPRSRSPPSPTRGCRRASPCSASASPVRAPPTSSTSPAPSPTSAWRPSDVASAIRSSTPASTSAVVLFVPREGPARLHRSCSSA